MEPGSRPVKQEDQVYSMLKIAATLRSPRSPHGSLSRSSLSHSSLGHGSLGHSSLGRSQQSSYESDSSASREERRRKHSDQPQRPRSRRQYSVRSEGAERRHRTKPSGAHIFGECRLELLGGSTESDTSSRVSDCCGEPVLPSAQSADLSQPQSSADLAPREPRMTSILETQPQHCASAAAPQKSAQTKRAAFSFGSLFRIGRTWRRKSKKDSTSSSLPS